MTTTETAPDRPTRPLSPHLSIYRPIITMVMSIMHRVTGVMNVAGVVLVVAFIMGVAAGPQTYDTVAGIYGSWIGRIVIVTFTWALIHHMLGGLRHAVWDLGRGLGEVRYAMSWATLVGSLALTGALWAVVIVVENV